MTELELIREGKTPLRYENGKAVILSEPFYERMQFLEALVDGYMRLWQRNRIIRRCEK